MKSLVVLVVVITLVVLAVSVAFAQWPTPVPNWWMTPAWPDQWKPLEPAYPVPTRIPPWKWPNPHRSVPPVPCPYPSPYPEPWPWG